MTTGGDHVWANDLAVHTHIQDIPEDYVPKSLALVV